MAWEPQKSKWEWRNFLTPGEESFIARADRAESQVAKARAAFEEMFGRERSLLVNRAIQRAKYAASSPTAKRSKR